MNDDIQARTERAFDDALEQAGGAPKPPKPTDPRELELAELRARRAKLQADRDRRAEENELDRELELERRKLREEEALSAAIEQHGELGRALATVESGVGTVIVRRCTPLKFRRFQDKEDFSAEAVEALARPCIVYPPLAEFDEWLKEEPVLVFRVGTAVTRLAGARTEELGKK